jgi:hypothetical protein
VAEAVEGCAADGAVDEHVAAVDVAGGDLAAGLSDAGNAIK